MSEKSKDDFKGRAPSYNGEVAEGAHDAVFGEITEDGPNYRAVCFSLSTVLVNIAINFQSIYRSDGREQRS
jgi:hypothetical protein